MNKKKRTTLVNRKKFSGRQQEKKALRKMAFTHPHPVIQRKCLAVLLLMFLFSASLVGLILGLSSTTVRNYWHDYKSGGIKKLQKLGYKGSKRALDAHAQDIEESLETDPPHTISEAVERVYQLTGIRRSAKSVRNFLKQLQFRFRKVAAIPAKADIKKQAQFLFEHMYPRLIEAMNGVREVLFLDAAHFVHGSFLGSLWSKIRIFIKAPSGRKRFNILGAVNAVTKQLHILSNDSYINSQVICEFLKEIAKVYIGKSLTIILDNARYQRCELVQSLATSLGIQLLFLPSYSPNLNIIERVWKFIKKKTINSRYYATFSDFQGALLQSVENCNGKWSVELRSLLSLNFQKFSDNESEAPTVSEGEISKIVSYQNEWNGQPEDLLKAFNFEEFYEEKLHLA